MSKRFKPQDYVRYKKLGLRWRKPKGHQSKLRVGKGGSGMLVKVGYGSKPKETLALITSVKDVNNAKRGLIASGVGAKETLRIAEYAAKLGVKILNMKKIKRAQKLAKALQSRKETAKVKATKKEEEKQSEQKQAEKSTEQSKDEKHEMPEKK